MIQPRPKPYNPPPLTPDQQRLQELQNLMRCLQSLQDATSKAGGRPFTFADLEEMSAARLICLLANNDIVFIYTGKP